MTDNNTITSATAIGHKRNHDEVTEAKTPSETSIITLPPKKHCEISEISFSNPNLSSFNFQTFGLETAYTEPVEYDLSQQQVIGDVTDHHSSNLHQVSNEGRSAALIPRKLQYSTP